MYQAVYTWCGVKGGRATSPFDRFADANRAAMRLCVVLLATTALTHAVFFGEDRYHLVVTPVLAILAAGALRRVAREHEYS